MQELLDFYTFLLFFLKMPNEICNHYHLVGASANEHIKKYLDYSITKLVFGLMQFIIFFFWYHILQCKYAIWQGTASITKYFHGHPSCSSTKQSQNNLIEEATPVPPSGMQSPSCLLYLILVSCKSFSL